MVQGVGFRYTVRRLASQFAVTGYVQNLRDGRVRLVAEGKGAELDDFLDAVRADMAHYIRSIEETAAEATGEFPRFDIRF
jgi:acylphosphatase